jgi:transposase
MLEAWENVEEAKRSSSKKRYVAGIDGFYVSSDRMSYFRDLGVVAADRLRYIVAFNIVFYQKEQKARHERIKKALLAIDELNQDLSQAKRDRDFNATERELLSVLVKHKVRNFFDYRLFPHNTKQGTQSFKIDLEPNVEAAIKAAQTDGLIVYVTNHTETRSETNTFAVHARDIVEHYKSKYRIERFFREMKSVVDLRPFHVWKEEHVKAHYDIAVIACFINNFINESLKRLLLESEMSLNDFYNELEKSAGAVTLMATNGHKTTKAKPISKPLAQALAALGIAPLLTPTKHAAHGVYH